MGDNIVEKDSNVKDREKEKMFFSRNMSVISKRIWPMCYCNPIVERHLFYENFGYLNFAFHVYEMTE